MFKLTGLFLLFTSSTLIGIYKASELTRRKKLLVEFHHMLQKLQTEISYFKEPLPIIFQKLLTNNNEPTNILLRQCCMGHECCNQSFQEKWIESIKYAYQNEPLKQADLEIFTKCGSFIGQSDFNSQKGHFELISTQLERQVSDAEEAVRRKGGLYTKAGISFGTVLAIALL